MLVVPFVLAFLPLVQSIVMLPVMFGPDTPLVVFKGQITQNGRPVPALLNLEVLYKLNGNRIPVSLVQVNSLANYEIHLSGLALRDENITNHAILRAQSLSIDGGSRAIRLHLKDGKLVYQQNIELNPDYEEYYYYDDYSQGPIRQRQHRRQQIPKVGTAALRNVLRHENLRSVGGKGSVNPVNRVGLSDPPFTWPYRH